MTLNRQKLPFQGQKVIIEADHGHSFAIDPILVL